MKRIALVCLLSSFFIPATAQRNIDVLHYKFNIELNDINDTIYGEAGIHFVKASHSKTIQFDLTSISKGKGMQVQSVNYQAGRPGETIIKQTGFTHTGNTITIPVAEKEMLQDSCFVIIKYKGIPADGLIISKNKYGNRTFFSDNWPNRAHNWIPCVDDPADKASVEFLVTAPLHYQVISNGVQVEETNLSTTKKLTHYREDVPLPTKVMVIGVADFAVNNLGDVDCVPVSSWVFPENRSEGFYDYAIGKEVLQWYIGYIAPFPYKKLANVQSKTMFGGMENAGAIFYYENSVTGKQNEEALVAHEIVHQWFGDMATEKSFTHLWLSEGFATYLTHVYLESKYGTDSLNSRMKDDREIVISFVNDSRKPVVDSSSDYMQLLNANSYQKGSWILHMLRRQLGDPVFQQAIRQYYTTYAGKNADSKDLQTIFETVSGENMSKFFDQWLHTDENLKLKISWKYMAAEKKIAVTVEQLQNKLFEFPLEIAMTAQDADQQLKTLKITKKVETFYFPATKPFTALAADPFASLLFEGTVTKAN